MNPSKDDIKALRKSVKGLSQTKFGVLVDSCLRAVQKWESGETKMPGAKWKLAKIEVEKLK